MRFSLSLSPCFFYRALLSIPLPPTFERFASQETRYLAGYLVKRRVHTSRVKYTESDFQLDAKPGSARYPFHLFYISPRREKHHSLIQKLNCLIVKNTIFNLTEDEINRTQIFVSKLQSISASVHIKFRFLFNLFILFIINLKDR